jgi:hypothetical protein
MIDERIARVKILIAKREEIDSELSALLGLTQTKRGRPRKETGSNGDGMKGDATAPDPAEPEVKVATLAGLGEQP